MHDSTNWPFDDPISELHYSELVQKLRSASDGGVVFFGAGASVPAGLPTWKQFHGKFLEHFGAHLGKSCLDGDIRTDIDYHTNRDEIKSLAFIKDVFGRPVADVPQIVGIAVATPALRYFYTTNIDEILCQAALGKAVAVYPDYKPMTAQFVYLHGRASTAKSVHEHLVLGNEGYRRAYEDAVGVSPIAKLRQLAPYPTIFLGFSMTDTAVMRTLREMAQAAKRPQEGSSGGQAVELAPQLNWYVALPAPPARDPGRIEEKRRTELSLRNAGVKVIWYQDGGQDRHRALLSVVQRLKRESRGITVEDKEEPGFVESLGAAEMLATVVSPTSTDLRRAEAVLRGHPRIASVFMQQVEGLEWFRELRAIGALDPKLISISANKTRTAPYWLAVDLLRRTAAIAPSEVKEFLLTIDTDNWVAIRQAFSILEVLDESSAAALGKRFANWAVTAMSVDSLMMYEVTGTAGQLDSDGKHEAAFALVEATLEELATSDPGLFQGSAARFSEAVAPILARSPAGLSAAVRTLRVVLQQQYKTADQDEVRYRRRAIEADRESLPDDSTLDLAITIVRETLLAISDNDSRANTVASLLGSRWPTERRIGIAHCFLRRSDLPQHEDSIITQENLANPHLFHELAKLITDGVGDLSEQGVQILKDFAEALHEQASDADRYDYDVWAGVLPAEWLPEPPPAEGEEDEHLFRDVYVSDIFTPGAPLDKAEFAARADEMTPRDLLSLVRDPEAYDIRVTWRHATEEMWTLLADYAKERNLLELLLETDPADVGSRRSWRVIEAMPEIAGNSPERWEKVLNWADRMVAEVPSDKFWSLGLLVEKSGSAAPLALSQHVKGLAIRVIEKTKRSSAEESEIIDKSLRGGFLNHPAGKATQALFELLRREMAEQEAATDTRAEIPQWFKETVLEHLEQAPMSLGIDVWIGVGRYFSLLYSRSPDAMAFVVQHLEAASSDLPITATAFWSGHLWAPSVSSESLERLRPAYRLHAPALQYEGTIETDLRDAFFQHIVIGVLREVLGFADILQDTLSDAFTPVARGSIASALARGIAEASEDPDTPFHSLATDQFRHYWAEHVKRVGGQDGDQLTNYLSGLREVHVRPTDIADLVEASLDQATNMPGPYYVMEYLGRYVEEDPRGVLRLLASCVEWYRLHGNFWESAEEVRTLLDRLTPLTMNEALLGEVLDGLAELGALSTDDVRRYTAGGSVESHQDTEGEL